MKKKKKKKIADRCRTFQTVSWKEEDDDESAF